MDAAWRILNRLCSFIDVLAYASTITFAEIENEKNMANGGVLRQCLRTGNCLRWPVTWSEKSTGSLLAVV